LATTLCRSRQPSGVTDVELDDLLFTLSRAWQSRFISARLPVAFETMSRQLE